MREAVNKESLPEKLNNRSTWQGEAVQTTSGLVRVGGVGIYHTDAIVRRSAPLQATSHAQVPAARIHPNTLAALGLQDGEAVQAGQGGAAVGVRVSADAGLPENVVYLPLHSENAASGALMNTIELTRG